MTPTPHPEDMPEREALTKAYMAFCADKAPDYNEVGFPYFKAAWQARASLAEQRTRAMREALMAVHIDAVHISGAVDEFAISRKTVDKVAAALSTPPSAPGKGEADGWQTIETAPRDCTPILAFWDVPGAIGCSHGVVAFIAGEWVEPENSDNAFREPTHWRPLPAAPAQSGGQGNG